MTSSTTHVTNTIFYTFLLSIHTEACPNSQRIVIAEKDSNAGLGALLAIELRAAVRVNHHIAIWIQFKFILKEITISVYVLLYFLMHLLP